ncbi:hypothetical protein [Pseudomonas chlororaphis]|nr:hypothetical protein [Pseudomonas chlororaphis]
MTDSQANKLQIVAIAEEIAIKAGKNAGVCAELLFPHTYLVLTKHFPPNFLLRSRQQLGAFPPIRWPFYWMLVLHSTTASRL